MDAEQHPEVQRLLDRVLSRFEGVEKHNGYYKAFCPNHSDAHRSLSLLIKNAETGAVKIRPKCHANCKYDDILRSAGLERRDMFLSPEFDDEKTIVATYDYTAVSGELLHQTVRYEPKDFRQRRPDGRGGWVWSLKDVEPVLYNLRDVTEAKLNGEKIYILEGEKDCDRAKKDLGIVATTCPMGAEKWRNSYTQELRGSDVVLIPDNDASGKRHMKDVGTKLASVAKSVRLVELPGLPDKGDLSGWLEAGGAPDEFRRLVDAAKTLDLFKPDPEGIGRGSGLNKSFPAYTVGEIKAMSGGSNEEGWLCPLFMKAGEITLFGGEAKRSGKTTFYMHMLKAVHDGRPFMGMPTISTDSLVLTEQGNNVVESTNKARIRDDDRILITPYSEVSKEEWADLIGGAVDHCKEEGLGILVVDTFATFSRLKGAEENVSGEIIARMYPVIDAARVHGLHVSLLHHTGYNGWFRGSSALLKDPDIIWLLNRPPGDHGPNVRALHGEGRYDAVNTGFNIALEDGGYVLLGTNSQIERSKAKSSLLKEVPSGKENRRRRTEVIGVVVAELGVSKTTVQRALEELIETRAVLEEKLKEKGNPQVLWRPRAKRTNASEDLFKPDSQGIGKEFGLNNTENGKSGVLQEKHEPKAPITSPESLSSVIEALEGTDTVALDLETTGLDPRSDSIRLLSLATKTATYLVDCQSVDPAELFPTLAQRTVVAHNALFDLGFLASLGFEPSKVADTMILSQLLHAGSKVEPLKRGQTSHSLASVLERELGLTLDKTHQSTDWGGPLSGEMIEYAAKDVEALLPLYEVLKAKIEEAGLAYVAEIEHRALPAVVWMSSAGVPIDVDGWREHAQRMEADAVRLEDELKDLAPEHPDGKAWNFGSPQQVRKAAQLLGVSLPDTRDETLALYAKEHKFINALRNYRKVSKLASTYGAAWLENGYHEDGRIYASWRQLRAATGRMACDHPNLQNIPRSGPLRSYIRAPQGRTFVIADYSQIELRIAAKISDDREMLSAYAEGRDLHTLTAQSLTGREDISKDDRKLAKSANFGLLYGMGAKGLRSYALNSYGIEMSLQEASLYRRRFFETYPGLKGWHDRERRAWQRGDTETHTLTGRRRMDVQRLTDRLNAPVQGTGADGLKLALALLRERRDECAGAVPVLACHDEIIVECDVEQAGEAKAFLEKAMIEGMNAVLNNVGEEHVPVTVESQVASFWGEG